MEVCKMDAFGFKKTSSILNKALKMENKKGETSKEKKQEKVVFKTRELKMMQAKIDRMNKHLANYKPGHSKKGKEALIAMNNFMGFDATEMNGQTGLSFNGNSLSTFKGDYNKQKGRKKNVQRKESKK